MSCQRCQSNNTARVSAKCSDMCSFQADEIETNDYVPERVGIGGGDYVAFEYCLDCGQIQGRFPIAKRVLNELRDADTNTCEVNEDNS